jgi:hypothetical protein
MPFTDQDAPSRTLAEPQVISERVDGHVHGRAVKLGEPGGRLAEKLKVMQVSACVQGGKDAIRFHKMVFFRFTFYTNHNTTLCQQYN